MEENKRKIELFRKDFTFFTESASRIVEKCEMLDGFNYLNLSESPYSLGEHEIKVKFSDGIYNVKIFIKNERIEQRKNMLREIYRKIKDIKNDKITTK